MCLSPWWPCSPNPFYFHFCVSFFIGCCDVTPLKNASLYPFQKSVSHSGSKSNPSCSLIRSLRSLAPLTRSAHSLRSLALVENWRLMHNITGVSRIFSRYKNWDLRPIWSTVCHSRWRRQGEASRCFGCHHFFELVFLCYNSSYALCAL